GLGQGDVETFFPRVGAFEQKLQRHRGLAGAGRAFHQEQMAPRKPARQDVVEPPNPGFRLAGDRSSRVHATPKPGQTALAQSVPAAAELFCCRFSMTRLWTAAEIAALVRKPGGVGPVRMRSRLARSTASIRRSSQRRIDGLLIFVFEARD